MSTRTVDDFEVGQRVTYVPYHANGDRHHPDCEEGVVTSKNARFVFVKFKPWHAHGQACKPDQLQ